MKIYRIAANPKVRLQQFKEITNPYIIFFIWNYENLIPWQDIKIGTAEADINHHINNVLLPQVFSKTDRYATENNYFNENIDMEAQLAADPDNPAVQAAYQIYLNNPEHAQQTLKDKINKEKEEIFRTWRQNGVQDHQFCIDNPGVSYALFKRMLEESPSNEQGAPTSFSSICVDKIAEDIKSNPKRQLNIWDLYKWRIGEILYQDLKHVDKNGNGWKHIPWKGKDPEHYEYNKNILRDVCVGTGWCVGTLEEYREKYLGRDGDFWIYVETKKKENINKYTPRVAVSLGNGGKTAEIRAKFNKPATEYADQVLDLYETENLNPQNSGRYGYLSKNDPEDPSSKGENAHLNDLRKIYNGVNKKLESGKITWKDITFRMYIQLSQSNKDKMPQEEKDRVVREFVAAGITIDMVIPSDFENYAIVKDALSLAWISELRKNPKVYETNRFPEGLKGREDVMATRLDAWTTLIGEDESLLEKAPADILNNNAIYDKVIDKVVIKLNANPLSYIDISYTMRRGQQRIIDVAQNVVLPAYIERIKKDPMFYDNVAHEFTNNDMIKDSFKEGYITLIKKNPAAKNQLICRKKWGIDLIQSLNKTKEVEDAYQEGLQEYRRKRGMPTIPAKPKEEPKKPEPKNPEPQTPPVNNNPNGPIASSKAHKLICSSCNSKIERINKSFRSIEDIYHCPKCDNMGTIDEM